MMTLYSGITDPFSHRCRIVLYEKGMDFEIIDVDLAGDRRLSLRHAVRAGAGLLDTTQTQRVLQHLAELWSYDVILSEVDGAGTVLKEHVAKPQTNLAAA
jgi:spore cortex formation protein SpoVR/YcgB (stage V sporulation)